MPHLPGVTHLLYYFYCNNFLPLYTVRDDEIKSTKLSSYFSFMQDVKSANGVALTETIRNHYYRGNNNLFKDFCNTAEMKKNN